MNNEKIEKIIENMSLDELVGQLICYSVTLDGSETELEKYDELFKTTKPGGVFLNVATAEQIKKVSSLVNKYTSVPVIVSGDTEYGPNPIKDCEHTLTNQMAWGACDDAELIERGGKVTAQLCRKSGMHWSFAPVVDINYNKDNPITNTRAVSDSPKQVVKIAGAYLKGLQSEGLMAGGCKHFPGDGLDDRNQHFCTSVNSMSKEEWMSTYGYVYKEMFKLNPGSVMVGHICLPAFQTERDDLGAYLPGTLSKSIMTDLLRGELGFEGCIVSDALSMIGVAAAVPENELPVRFINAGGDMLLFAEPSYFGFVKAAVEDGTVSYERLKDAVRRILRLKETVGLLSGEEPEVVVTEDIGEIATQIAEKSIKIVRNVDNVLPLDLNEGDTVLICTMHCKPAYIDCFRFTEEALNSRGIKTVRINNASYKEVHDAMEEHNFAAILINCGYNPMDCSGASLRVGWSSIMCFWRGHIFRNPKVVFTSFGDPYKLYELPFLRTYINTFSSTQESQEAFVRVILGEIEAKGKNPVALEGYFEREV